MLLWKRSRKPMIWECSSCWGYDKCFLERQVCSDRTTWSADGEDTCAGRVSRRYEKAVIDM